MLATSALVACATTAGTAGAADPIRLTLGGYYAAAAGFTNTGNHDGPGEPNHDVQAGAFKQNVEVYFNGDTTLDNGMTVGAHIELEGNNDAGHTVDVVYTYFKGGFGQVRFGDTYGPLSQACVLDPGYITNNFGLISPNNSFTNVGRHAAVGLGSIGTCEDAGQKGTKVGYVTPKFDGFQAAISYGWNGNRSAGPTTGTASNADTTHNLIELYGIYQHEFDGWSLTAGAGAEWALHGPGGGHPPAFYQAGFQVGLGRLTIGASGEFWQRYVNAGLADTGANNPISQNSNAWVASVGASYKIDAWTVGLEAIHGAFEIADSHDVDTYNAVSLQGTYALGPGIVLEGEVAYFWYMEDHQLPSPGPRATANSASIGLGSYIEF
ncbi:MAG: porin [Dongiaceae bacterium]